MRLSWLILLRVMRCQWPCLSDRDDSKPVPDASSDRDRVNPAHPPPLPYPCKRALSGADLMGKESSKGLVVRSSTRVNIRS
ncbi:hypothetical protein F5X98DRAFT_3459 [Xylaria grammica]|nr:hypothetical protein F5X98DRAFT_3459 [Xylaria grammica]